MKRYRIILVPSYGSGYSVELSGEELNLSCYTRMPEKGSVNVNTFTLEEAEREIERYFKSINHSKSGEGEEILYQSEKAGIKAYLRPAEYIIPLERKDGKKIVFFPYKKN